MQVNFYAAAADAAGLRHHEVAGPLTAAELVRALRRDGWEIERQRGSHVRLRHSISVGLVTVPVHSGKTIPPQVLDSILDQAGLSLDELRALL